MRFYINIIIAIFISSALYSQNWSMEIQADEITEVEDDSASDYISLGMCQGCHDQFHFAEDEYDLPPSPGYYTDISFFNYDWIGIIDENGVSCCNTPEFYIDKKNWHSPSDLLIWKISGITNLSNSENNIELSWSMDEISNDYQIYLYIGENSYNMRTLNNLTISSEDLSVQYDINQQIYSPNIQILMGGCAAAGTTTYYYDNDQDGYGGSLQSSQEFCNGFEPDGWVPNNDDVNDNFYCIENIIDQCNICNGNNACLDCAGTPFGEAQIDDCNICAGGTTGLIANFNMDCNNDCFGSAIIDDCQICSGGNTSNAFNQLMDCSGECNGDSEVDDCGVCSGFNQSCLNDIFADGPMDLNAYINNNSVELTWNQPNYPESEFIVGFNIYRNEEYIISTEYEEYLFQEFNNGEFCVSAFDQYNNESNRACSLATEEQQFCWILKDGLNLISYPILPQDITISNIFSSLENYITAVISEGDAASLLPNGIWAGSLTQIENYRGYWIKVDLGDPFATQEYCISGYPLPQNLQYNLSEGANLVSYLGQDNAPIQLALGDYNNNFDAIIGAAYAAYNNSELNWVGSLTNLNRGEGYWVIVNETFIFNWETID